jgi:hypothetical protein
VNVQSVFAVVLLIGATPSWSQAQSSGTTNSGTTAGSGSNQPVSAATHCRDSNGQPKLNPFMAGMASGGTTGAASGTGPLTEEPSSGADKSSDRSNAAQSQSGSSQTVANLPSC